MTEQDDKRARCCVCNRPIKNQRDEYHRGNGTGPYCRICMLKEKNK